MPLIVASDNKKKKLQKEVWLVGFKTRKQNIKTKLHKTQNKRTKQNPKSNKIKQKALIANYFTENVPYFTERVFI